MGLSRSTLAGLLLRSAVVQSALTAALAEAESEQPPAANEGPGKMLTAKQVAEHFEVKESWVMSEARANRIPKRMVGRYVRFDLAEVKRALERRQV